MRTRDLRRHHEARRRARLRHIVRNVWLSDTDERFIAQYAQNHAICSCPLCGNQRRHYGILPYQWERANEAARYDLQEVL